MEKDIKNPDFHSFSKWYLIISLFLNLIIFIYVLIWILINMTGVANVEIIDLLQSKTFLKLSFISTLGTFILGSVSPVIYSLLTSPIDTSTKYTAKSDWERELRSDNKDVLSLLPFLLFSTLLFIFMVFFCFTTQTQIFNFILVLSVLIFIVCLCLYKLSIFLIEILRKLSKKTK
ncbi:hypothetical protein BU051_11850 [Staphylococcus simulans]|nr:hypothetical protein BU014_11410 [Staphylococcus simulans]PTJ83056.1 hypothetical protein BU051_11850 [Staphylococcus simulans]